jgi:hypothetical protein
MADDPTERRTIYTAWSWGGGDSTLIEGKGPPPRYTTADPHYCPDLIWTIEATSWEDAMRRYHELQGWEPYKPLDDET